MIIENENPFLADEWLGSHVKFEEPKDHSEKEEVLTGFRKFVNDLKDSMTVNFIPSEELRKEIEAKGWKFEDDFESWVALVEETEEKELKIEGHIPVSDGKDLRIVPGFTKRARSLEDNCSRSSKLYSVALATAKLELVRDMATSVYPTLETNFDEQLQILDEMQNFLTTKSIDEIAGKKVSNGSLEDVFKMTKGGKLGKLTTLIIVSGILLAACATPAQATGPETPWISTPTAISQPTEAPVSTAVSEPTALPTEIVAPTEVVVDKEVIWLDENISYAGHEMRFTYSFSSGDTTVNEAFEKFKISGFEFNELNPNARENIVKMIAIGLLETYNEKELILNNNFKKITLDEYLANPEKFPAEIVALNAKGEKVRQVISISDIKELNITPTSNTDLLFNNMPGGTSLGYGFDEITGKFTLFNFFGPRDQNLSGAIKMTDSELKQLYIGHFAQSPLYTAIVWMPYILPFQDRLITQNDIGVEEMDIVINGVFYGGKGTDVLTEQELTESYFLFRAD